MAKAKAPQREEALVVDEVMPFWVWAAGIPWPGPLSWLEVGGFKSLSRPCRVEIRPLTLLAGANSSGKSSLLQPMLLLKQTLESSFDPGGVLLSGSHAHFARAKEMLSFGRKGGEALLEVGFGCGEGYAFRLAFASPDEVSLVPFRLAVQDAKLELKLEAGMAGSTIQGQILPDLRKEPAGRAAAQWHVRQQGPLLVPAFEADDTGQLSWARYAEIVPHALARKLFELVQVLHVPALRLHPKREYPRTGTSRPFPGTFDVYAASLVLAWQEAKDPRIAALESALEALGLTWKIQARQLDANRVEIKVARQPKRSRAGAELVNIADVGFGTAQVLPILVALLEAKEGELVYLEQPEVHLHPRAQSVLADLLVQAAQRGVRVIVETHSDLLLLGVLTAVADGEISPADVALHWFSRDKNGVTNVEQATIEETGAYGEWPEDFGDTQAAANRKYLTAARQVVERKAG
jgi:hypothetical protein